MAVKNKSKTPARSILIVDDHPMMRTGLAQLIGNEPDLKVAAEADTAGQAINLVAKQKFDLALLDISLPDKNGLELIKDLRALRPELPILVVSMHDEMIYAERVLRAGGRGYIMKQEGGQKFLKAIRSVLAGQVFVGQHFSRVATGRLGRRHARHLGTAAPEHQDGGSPSRQYQGQARPQKRAGTPPLCRALGGRAGTGAEAGLAVAAGPVPVCRALHGWQFPVMICQTG